MGITLDNFFQNIYDVIFSPKAFFENENMTVSTRLAAGLVTVYALLNASMEAAFDSSFSAWFSLFGSLSGVFFSLFIVLSIVSALTVWILTALFFEYTAKIFNQNGCMRKLLYLTAFASIPSVFLAPVNLLKQAGAAGYCISAVLTAFIFIWIVILYTLAVKSAYKITAARAFMFIFLPAAALIPALYQTAVFYSKVCYILAV